MPNPTDDDRISATTTGGVVVDLDAYRERASSVADTAKAYVSPTVKSWGLIVLFFVVLLAFFARR